MNVLVSFLPFLAVALLVGPAGTVPALVVGALCSAAILIHTRLSGRAPKILEIGSLLLFSLLAGFEFLRGGSASANEVKLWVDLGLLAIALVSLAVRRPFTVQYAREQVPAELWTSPEFLRKNDVVTGAWAAAFLVMVLTEAALVYLPGVPHGLGVTVIVLAVVGAVKFTVHASRPRPTPAR